MANEEHLALLRQGVDVWNEWRQNHNNYEIVADLTGANLSGLSIIGADLGRANLMGANLIGANLTEANLRMANLSEANLAGANITGGDLRMANLRMANLSETNLTEADITGAYLSLANLRMAYLSGANLSETNLKMTYLGGAILTDANLKMANLNGANLEGTQALNANFKQAIFTGSCLENWQINKATNLNDVICDYVYLRHHQQERCPSNRNFVTGEFTKLFQTALDTVDSPSSQDEFEIIQSAPVDAALPNNRSEQSLAEVAAEIRHLLQQLERTYPTTSPLEKLTLVLEAVKAMDSNPPLKARLVNILKEDDTAAFKALVAHPLTNKFLAALED